jgi:TetR/AcrR family transcriptional regulator, transcriptional repressor for nem operon
MPRPPTQTKEKIVDAAMYLFWERGYNAAAIADILERAQANSGSFYYFFKSKEALLDAVLDRYLESLDAIIVSPVFEALADPIERIFGILAGYRDRVIMTNYTYGCPLGRLVLEIDPGNLSARAKLAANFRAWVSVIERCLIDAKDSLPRDLNASELAQFVLTVMEGAVMQSRAYGSIEPFDASVSQLRNYFERLLAAGSSNT